MRFRLIAVAATAVGDGALLVALPAPRPATLFADLRHPASWLATAGAEQATVTLAGAALWLAVAWLGVGLAAALAVGLPGAAGSAARRLARVTLPRSWYRVLLGAAGLGATASIVLGPVAANAVTAVPPPGGAGTAVASAHQLPAPELPTTTRSAPLLPTGTPSPAHAVAPPVSAPPAPAAAPSHAPSPPSRTESTPTRTQTSHPVHTVTVRPGDSLWRIAAAHLPAPASPAKIATAWPRWWAANRAVVGPDPDVLLPGQRLEIPEEFR